MANASIMVPHLAEGQKVKDWRRMYLAATALLTEDQKIALIPVYVSRNAGETDIAHICAQKKPLKAALDELELLIDGAPSRMIMLNRFWELKPASRDFNGLTSFFFTLQAGAKGARVPNDVMLLRYLNFVPNGEKFFAQNEDTITEDISDEDSLTVFKKIQTKLVRNEHDASGMAVKKEKDDSFIFNVEDGNEMPKWAENMQKELSEIKEKMTEDQAGVADDKDSGVFYGYNGQQKSRTGPRCYNCNKIGHIASRCYSKKCKCCGGVGHDEEKCPSKSAGRKPKGNRDTTNKRPL